MRIDLFVAQCNQGEHGFVRAFLLGRGRVRRAGGFPSRRYAQLVFQFENDSLCRLFPEAANFRERHNIGIHHRRFEIVHAHPTQDRERQLRSDSADVIDQQPKQIALRRAHESVKHVRIFANDQMSENVNRLTNRRKFVVTRKRNENLVTDTTDIDRRLRRQRLNEPGISFYAQDSDFFEHRPVDIVDITDAQDRTVTVYFNRSTKLPVYQTFRRRNAVDKQIDDEVTRFSKYRDVGGGVMWPFAIQRERNGEKIFEMYSESVVIDKDLKDDLFTLPVNMKILKKEK